MSDIVYQKVIIQHVSLETYEEGGASFDDGGLQSLQPAGEIDKEYFMSLLTRKQRTVATYLFDGYDRIRIADQLGVSVQAVHQIIPRIRKRLHKRAGISLKGWKRRHGGY